MTHYKTGDCSAESLWSDPKELLGVSPYGYVKDGDLKIPFWATCDDPLQVPGCQMVLVKFLDGSPVAVRYKKTQIVSANMCPKCYRDLDFIKKILGAEGLALHQRAHERDEFKKSLIKSLESIRARSGELFIQNAINDLIRDLK